MARLVWAFVVVVVVDAVVAVVVVVAAVVVAVVVVVVVVVVVAVVFCCCCFCRFHCRLPARPPACLCCLLLSITSVVYYYVGCTCHLFDNAVFYLFHRLVLVVCLLVLQSAILCLCLFDLLAFAFDSSLSGLTSISFRFSACFCDCMIVSLFVVLPRLYNL